MINLGAEAILFRVPVTFEQVVFFFSLSVAIAVIIGVLEEVLFRKN